MSDPNRIKIRTIEGWLQQAINDHGPITAENAHSAAKRLWGQLANCSTDNYWHRRYKKLKFAYDRLLEREERREVAS